jgi:hypothetical protein
MGSVRGKYSLGENINLETSKPKTYFLGCAVGGSMPFNRRYMADCA